tara:strand:+ start:161 stop:1498 length:1338 start_codon:yes stop_codon:yes gene_type:complete
MLSNSLKVFFRIFNLKQFRLFILSTILFLQIYLIGIWSNPSLNSILAPDSYDYLTLAGNLFNENANFRPPAYPVFLWISSLIGNIESAKNIFLMQLTLHALTIYICFLFLNYLKINVVLAYIICLIAGINPSQLYHISNIVPEMLLCSIITICWVLSLFFIYNSGNFLPIPVLILIGIISGVAALTKPVWLLGIFPILISILLLNNNKKISPQKISTLLIGAHFSIIFFWNGINYIKNVPLQRGKTLTVNICMASIRSGLIKYGEGTAIHEQLRKNGNLKQALLLNGEDNQNFRNIYASLSWEQRYDPQFANCILQNAKLEFTVSQLKYWHYFFINRMFSPNKKDSFIKFPEVGKRLYVVLYSYFYRPLMPALLILSIIIMIFKKKYRPLLLTSLAILVYFSIVIIMFSKSQSSVMRMRVPVEIILFICTLYPTMDLLKNYLYKK